MATESALRRLIGPLLMIAACIGFAFIDMLAKYLGRDLPVAEVLFLRYLVQALTVCAIYLPGLRGRMLRTANLPMQGLRGGFLLGASVCVINGLTYLPLAESTAVHFLSPIFISLLAALFLGERTTRIDWLALLLGFAGVLVIVRPGGALLTWAILFPVGSALCNALYQIVTRFIRASEHPGTSNLYAALVGLLATAPFVPAVWRLPDWQHAGLIALAGAVAALAHLLVTRALAYAPAGSLGPYSYTQLAWAAVFGFLVFGSLPDAFALAGIGLIGASGLLLSLHRLWVGRSGRASVPPVE